MRSPGRTTFLLFLIFQALYALTSSGNAFRAPNEFELYFQVEHLVDAGDISVPQTLTPVGAACQGAGSEDVKAYRPLDAAFSAALMYALPLQLTVLVDAGGTSEHAGFAAPLRSAWPPTRQTTADRASAPTHFRLPCGRFEGVCRCGETQS